MGDLYNQCVKDVNHYIERADGNSQKALGLWDDDRNAYIADCIERGIGWSANYLWYVQAMEHTFKEMAANVRR